MGEVVSAIVQDVIALALQNWALMLLIGVLWHTFGVLEPIGYWETMPISFLGTWVLATAATRGVKVAKLS